MNSGMNKIIECVGECREGLFCGRRQGRDNPEDDVSEVAQKIVCKAEEKDT